MLTAVSHERPPQHALEMSLEASERLISQARARQVQALATLDAEQVATRDGARSLHEWVAARLDVSTETATNLVEAMKLFEQHPASAQAVASGDISFDRGKATRSPRILGRIGRRCRSQPALRHQRCAQAQLAASPDDAPQRT